MGAAAGTEAAGEAVAAKAAEAAAAVEKPKADPWKIEAQPIREDQVANAVNFLSHPKVRSSPIVHRRTFLERKGLTPEEIDEAFRRCPVPYLFLSHLQQLSNFSYSLLFVFFFSVCYHSQ